MRDTQVLDSRHVAFKMGRDEYYLVQFKKRCFGLRANRPVRLNMRNSRLCKFVRYRALIQTLRGHARGHEVLYSWLYPSDQGAG